MLETDSGLDRLIVDAVRDRVAQARTTTHYRVPLVSFADAADPRFPALRRYVDPGHLTPEELLSGARSVVSFFVPFDRRVVEANAADPHVVAREWALAYTETNTLITQITDHLIELLATHGIRGASEPPIGNFERATLTSHWSHKSVAVIAGLGSFGLHHMIITEAGCAGRLGSLVVDGQLPVDRPRYVNRCLYLQDRSCGECLQRCPVSAFSEDNEIDRHRCWNRILEAPGLPPGDQTPQVCGKCAIGPCSLESPL